MINYFFIVIIFSFSINMFSFTTTLGKVKRVFEGFDYNYAEMGVLSKKESLTQPNGPYFYPTRFSVVVDEYFQENFKEMDKNSFKYEVSKTYSDPYLMYGSMTNYNRKATINFKCTFNYIYTYENSKTFVVKEKN